MHITYLRKVGGSIMLSVPPAILDVLHLRAGSPVGFYLADNKLIVEPNPRASYSLEELLRQCDASRPITQDDKEWSNIGQEPKS